MQQSTDHIVVDFDSGTSPKHAAVQLAKRGRKKEKETSKHLDTANFPGRQNKQEAFQRQVCSLYLSAAGIWDFFCWLVFFVFLFSFCLDSDSLELFSEALELFPESLEDLSELSLLSSSSSSLSLLDSATPTEGTALAVLYVDLLLLKNVPLLLLPLPSLPLLSDTSSFSSSSSE